MLYSGASSSQPPSVEVRPGAVESFWNVLEMKKGVWEKMRSFLKTNHNIREILNVSDMSYDNGMGYMKTIT